MKTYPIKKRVLKKGGGSLLSFSLIAFFSFLPFAFSLPDPKQAQVENGGADFNQLDNSTLNITTATDNTIINWSSPFSIAANETVNFYQPLTSASVLNRDLSGSVSNIFGTLNSFVNGMIGGRIFLENPAGIQFGPTAHVNVGSLVASTLHLSSENFLSGNFSFENASNSIPSFVINQGIIDVQEGGSVALLGGAVRNEGTIRAKLGSVVMAAGEKMTLSFGKNGFLSVAVDEGLKEQVLNSQGEAFKNAVENSGTIETLGGNVKITAQALMEIFDRLVNQTGIIEAQSVVEREGSIELAAWSGSVLNSGSLRAGGTEENPNGGGIRINGKEVSQLGEISTNALDNGQAGNIEITSSYRTLLGPQSTVEARGWGVNSRGGEVVVNSLEGNTDFLTGSEVDVSGGSVSGDAGFIELSGKTLLFGGQVLGEAQEGFRGGNLLVDPLKIVFNTTAQTAPTDNAAPTPDIAFNAAPAAGTTTVEIADIVNFNEARFEATEDIDVNNALVMKNNKHLVLRAGNNLNLNANVQVKGSGNMTLTADADFSAGGGPASNGIGTINQAVGTSILAANGTVTLQTGGDFTVRTITKSGAGTLSITSSAGNILDDGNAATAITGNVLTLTANATGKGVGTSGALNTAVGTLNLNVGSGGADIANSGAMTVNSAASSGGGNIAINNSGGDLTIKTIDAGAGNVSLTTATGKKIKDDNDNTTKVTAETLTVDSGSDVGAKSANGRLDTSVNHLTAETTNGSMYITNDKTLTVDTATVGGAGKDIYLTTSAGDLVLDQVTSADDFTLTAAGAALALNSNSIIDGDTLTLSAGTDIGSAALPLHLKLTSSKNTTTLTATSGSVHAQYQTGDLTISSQAIAGGVSTFTVADGTPKGSTIKTSSASGDLTLQALVGSVTSTPNLTFNNGSLALRAGNNVTLNGNVTTTGAGSQTYVADNDSSGVGTFTQAAGKTVSTGAGAITISSAGSPILRTVSNTGTMNITSTQGGIFNNSTSLTADHLSLTAKTGIGTNPSHLPTAVNSLEATTETGGIFVVNTGDLTINGTGVTVTDSGNIGLRVLAGLDDGSLYLQSNLLTPGDVDLDADGGIFSGGGGTIFGHHLSLSAVEGIGDPEDFLETVVSSLSGAVTGPGSIYVSNTGSLVIPNGSLTTADGDINVATDGDLTLGLVEAGGSVSLGATGSIFDSNGDLNNISASSDSILTAGGTIGLLEDPLDVLIEGGVLEVSALSQTAGVSVDINGVVNPSNTLFIIGDPPGLVIFNGRDLRAVAGAPSAFFGPFINDLFGPFLETISELLARRRLPGFPQ